MAPKRLIDTFVHFWKDMPVWLMKWIQAIPSDVRMVDVLQIQSTTFQLKVLNCLESIGRFSLCGFKFIMPKMKHLFNENDCLSACGVDGRLELQCCSGITQLRLSMKATVANPVTDPIALKNLIGLLNETNFLKRLYMTAVSMRAYSDRTI